jgi:glutamyl-tRNA synthetase
VDVTDVYIPGNGASLRGALVTVEELTAMSAPRLRFPPAPSGWLHVGGARTALYNWLGARGSGGTFVLRIEDTDADRSDVAAQHGMRDSLRWLGLSWDEGPEVGGPCGPYVQSERRPLHDALARRLLAAGAAYEAFETPDELEADRRRAQAEGRPPGYSGAHRDLTEEQKAALRAQGREPVLRLRTPDEGTLAFDDLVRGRVEVAWAEIDDFVIARADGSPTYYLANTADDLAQSITLVARGEDLLNAVPRQVLLARALLGASGDSAPVAEPGAAPVGEGASDREAGELGGPGGHGPTLLDDALAEVGFPPRPDPAAGAPQWAHLPVIVGEDGKKLSKRHGSVAVDDYRQQGVLPEVLCNFLALCGWGDETGRERFTVEELIERFSFQRVGRNPARFDTDKLRSLNGDAIKELSAAELTARLEPVFVEAGVLADPPTNEQRALLASLAPLLRPRIQTLREAVGLVAWCFADEVGYDEQSVAKHLKGRAGEVLDRAAEELTARQEWSAEAILEVFDALCAELELGRGKVMQPVRVAVAGTHVSPPLPETLAVLDRDVVVERIRAARPMAAEAT